MPDELQPVTDPDLIARLEGGTLKPVTDKNLIARLDNKPATVSDRVDAAEGGFLKGAAYLATSIPDAAANAWNLGKAALGTPWLLAGHTPPEALQVNSEVSPVGGALTRLMDKAPDLAGTQPRRPDDAVSRYLNAGASALPGALAGGGSLPTLARNAAITTAPALAGNAVAEGKPFGEDQPWSGSANNAASILAQGLMTAGMPRGRGADVPGREDQNAAIRAGQEAGFVFPPATTNPTPMNRLIESIAGKQNTQQHASLTNQGAANALTRQAMKIPGGTGPISDDEIAVAKGLAAPGYDAIRSVGTIQLTPEFSRDIANSLKKQSGASNLAPALKDSKLTTIANQLSKNSAFDANDAIDTIGMLRDKASEAYRQGNNGTGAAYKSLSKSIEDAIDRGLTAQGGDAASVLDAYRDSRKQFAIIHSVEDARDAATGNIQANKFADMLKKGGYLSGELNVIGKSAGQAPLAFKQPTHSTGVNHLGVWGALAGGGALAHELLPEHMGIWPMVGAAGLYGARAGAGKYALGPGQKNVIPALNPKLNAQQLAAALSSWPGYAQGDGR